VAAPPHRVARHACGIAGAPRREPSNGSGVAAQSEERGPHPPCGAHPGRAMARHLSRPGRVRPVTIGAVAICTADWSAVQSTCNPDRAMSAQPQSGQPITMGPSSVPNGCRDPTWSNPAPSCLGSTSGTPGAPTTSCRVPRSGCRPSPTSTTRRPSRSSRSEWGGPRPAADATPQHPAPEERRDCRRPPRPSISAIASAGTDWPGAVRAGEPMPGRRFTE